MMPSENGSRRSSKRYGRGLASLVVFGSVARGQAGDDSDVDCLIICDELPRGRMRRVRGFSAVEEDLAPVLAALAGRGIFTEVMPVLKTVEEALQRSPLFLDMVHDALILHDRQGFFRGVLAGMKARLDELGARRVYQDRRWYWILKPDFKPGEVFHL